MSKKLLLFDIDQHPYFTSGGAGEKALILASCDTFGPGQDLGGIELAGKTDVWIAQRIFELQGIEPTAEAVRALLDRYLFHLKTQLAEKQGTLLPGFPELLHRLARLPEVVFGLLTGNLRGGARIKLGHYGLLEHFSLEEAAVGAFADDSHDRNQLGPFAQRRALEKHGIDFPAPGYLHHRRHPARHRLCEGHPGPRRRCGHRPLYPCRVGSRRC